VGGWCGLVRAGAGRLVWAGWWGSVASGQAASLNSRPGTSSILLYSGGGGVMAAIVLVGLVQPAALSAGLGLLSLPKLQSHPSNKPSSALDTPAPLCAPLVPLQARQRPHPAVCLAQPRPPAPEPTLPRHLPLPVPHPVHPRHATKLGGGKGGAPRGLLSSASASSSETNPPSTRARPCASPCPPPTRNNPFLPQARQLPQDRLACLGDEDSLFLHLPLPYAHAARPGRGPPLNIVLALALSRARRMLAAVGRPLWAALRWASAVG
jgi:hypothetical protein